MHASRELFATFTAGIGLSLSLWTWRHSAGGRGLPGCGAGSGCDAVTRSRWSRWLGVSVAAPAAAVYLVLTIACVVMIASPATRAARDVALAGAGLLAGAAVWFVGLQALLLRRFCIYCLLLHGIGVVTAGLVLLAVPLPAGAELAWVASAAGAGIAALVLGQVLVRPTTYVVVPDRTIEQESSRAGDNGIGGPDGSGEAAAKTLTLPSPGVSGEGKEGPASATPATGSSDLATGRNRTVEQENSRIGDSARGPASATPSTASPFLGRRVMVLGRTPLQCGVWPVIGEADARDVLVFLFCYTCANCRHLHGLLGESMRRADGRRFSVMMVPVPTEPACNPNIKNCGPEHADACAYARLALWTWKHDWRKFAEMNEFLFAGKRPPAIDEAKEQAEELLGVALPDPRTAEPEADRLIGMGVALHKSSKAELTPALLLPRSRLAGRVPDIGKLEEVLAAELSGRARFV